MKSHYIRRVSALGVAGVVLLIAQAAWATVDLELTQGIAGGVPVEVVPFKGSDIIAHDLKYSGRFQVFQGAGNERAEYRVQGNVEPTKDKGRYRLQCQLLGLYDQNAVLFDKTYTAEKKGLRQLAHHCSDAVYKALLGVKGAFSTHIAYVVVESKKAGHHQYRLEIADADGHDPKTLLTSSQPIMSPTWSPKGHQIAYVSFEGHRAAIYSQEITSGKRHLVSKFPGINGAPAWSPDGKTLALVLSKTGMPKIYALDWGTRVLHQLTQGSSMDTEPTWLPDGKSFLFTSNRGGGPQIYRFWLASGKVDRITFEGNYNAKPSVAADGRHMAFLHREGRLLTIAVMDLRSGYIRIVTDTGMSDSPSIAANGESVMYAIQDGEQHLLGIVSNDGRVKLRLPARQGSVQTPAWSSQ